MKPKVFLSYRRGPGQHAVGRIYDTLVSHLGEKNVFMDTDSIKPGQSFPEEISRSISSCDYFLAIISEGWLGYDPTTEKRRIDDLNDWVRIEVETALQSSKTNLIPILIGPSSFPKKEELPISIREILRSNTLKIRVDPDFSSDVSKLIEVIYGKPRRRIRILAIASITIVSVMILLSFYIFAPHPISFKPDKDSYSLMLSGKPNYIEVPSSLTPDLNDALTIEAWIRIRDWYGDNYFPIVDRAWRLEADKSSLVFTAGYSSGASSGFALPLNKWTHVAATYDLHAQHAEFYINGLLVATRDYKKSFLNIPNHPLYIGRGITGGDEYAKGYFDNVRIWNVVRTKKQIRKNANRGIPLDQVGLLANWNFDDPDKSVVKDYSINNRNGFINGKVRWILSENLTN